MNIEFTIRAAQALVVKADKEAECGLSSAGQDYKLAAKKYHELATLVPDKAEEYNALANQYEEKANGTFSSVQVNRTVNNAVNINQPKNVGVNKPQGFNSTKNQTNNKTEEKLSNATAVQSDNLTVEQSMEKLNGLVGLTGVKKKVADWVSSVRINKMREMQGLPTLEDFSYHLVFSGNPGTGKTTVARIMANIYKALGIVECGQLVETSRTDLVAGYVGQTAIKTQEVIDQAMDGILFIDEAYTLMGNGNGNDFGQEAINTLLKAMEDHRDRLIVIIAGYTKEMADFIDTNPGLQSRFTNKIEFEDYTGEEMMMIFQGLCAKNKLVMTNGAKVMVKDYFNNLYNNRDKNFGNGRTVRNTFQSIMLAQANRLDAVLKNTSYSDEEIKHMLVSITEGDVALATKTQPNEALIEYQRVKEENNDAKIYELLGKNDFASLSTKLCTRLESTLRYVFKLDGTLDEMIKQLRKLPDSSKLNLTKEDFDCLYKIRVYRNSVVHSTGAQCEINPVDIVSCLKIINIIENSK